MSNIQVGYQILIHTNYLGVSHKFNFFFFGNESISLAHRKKIWNYGSFSK
jgi:hypothetical protein